MKEVKVSPQTCVGRRWCRFLVLNSKGYFCGRDTKHLHSELMKLDYNEVFTPKKPLYECQKELHQEELKVN